MLTLVGLKLLGMVGKRPGPEGEVPGTPEPIGVVGVPAGVGGAIAGEAPPRIRPGCGAGGCGAVGGSTLGEVGNATGERTELPDIDGPESKLGVIGGIGGGT